MFCSTLAMAMAVFTCAAQAQQECHLKPKAVLPMTIDPTGRVTVPATVAGKNLDFLIDTGGILSMVTPAAAAALALPVQDIRDSRARMFGGVPVNSYITAPTFQLGRLLAENVDLMIVPAFAHESGVGTIAPDLMAGYDVDFDFANGKLTLFSTEHCPGKVVYWTGGDYSVIPIKVDHVHHIRAMVEVDGKEIEAVIDTGAARTVMSLEKAQSAFDLDTPKGALKPIGDYDLGKVYPFKTLSLGGVVVNNPNIVLLSDRFSGVFYYDTWALQQGPLMIIGADVLRHLHVYLSYNEEKIYVTAATAN